MELYKGKKISTKKGKIYEVVNFSENTVSLELLNDDIYVLSITKDELVNYYELDFNNQETINLFTNKTNRSVNQTMFLLNLLNNDTNMLIALEEKIKNNYIHFCPSTIDEINDIMLMEEKEKYFKLDEFKN